MVDVKKLEQVEQEDLAKAVAKFAAYKDSIQRNLAGQRIQVKKWEKLITVEA